MSARSISKTNVFHGPMTVTFALAGTPDTEKLALSLPDSSILKLNVEELEVRKTLVNKCDLAYIAALKASFDLPIDEFDSTDITNVKAANKVTVATTKGGANATGHTLLMTALDLIRVDVKDTGVVFHIEKFVEGDDHTDLYTLTDNAA